MRDTVADASRVRAAGTAARRAQAPLQQFARTLWAGAPALRFEATAHAEADADRQAPFIVGNTLHLPALRPGSDDAAAWRWYRAAAAHGAAHRAFSPPGFDAQGLPPIARALLGLLEDARVEALACRELPGLRLLWAPLHTAGPHSGSSFPALLLRLARALLDTGYTDPHPWVGKGRRLFFVDAACSALALRRADDLRHAATLLGHDIGQMRLPFTARLYTPGPDYRDDQRWMWPAAAEPLPLQGGDGGDASADADAHAGGRVPAAPQPVASPTLYPEWDRLIARLRPDRCSVFEHRVADAPPLAGSGSGSGSDIAPAPEPSRQRSLDRALQAALAAARGRWQLSGSGDRLDLDRLLRAQLARRSHQTVDDRVFLRPRRQTVPGRAWLLIDQSASSAGRFIGSGHSLLAAARDIAWLSAQALQQAGVDAAIAGFHSNGRHEVHLRIVKDFGERAGPELPQRLAALDSSLSTRLGAALRHATRRLRQGHMGGPCHLLVISDGAPFDIDVHDPAYLENDARHAVSMAARAGVVAACVVLTPEGAASARRIFGARRSGVLRSLQHLPRLAARLLA